MWPVGPVRQPCIPTRFLATIDCSKIPVPILDYLDDGGVRGGGLKLDNSGFIREFAEECVKIGMQLVQANDDPDIR